MSNNLNEPTAHQQPTPQKVPSTALAPLSVIGIGASAGGLVALRSFFSALSDQSGLTFVVIVHLSPEHESVLASLLQPYTTMPVMQVTEHVEMQPDHVYVIPPGKWMVVAGNALELAELEETSEVKRTRPMQIDAFFRSLAENHGDGAAIILSGSGSDGAVGIRALKEKGGLLLVQSPEEAEYDGMPRSAIATGLVDTVAPVAELATQLVAAKQMRNTLQLPTNGEPLSEPMQQTLTQILTQLHMRTGHDFSRYKQATVLRRLARRMQITQVMTLTAYLHRLRQDSDEAELLFRDLLINVTEFFRDREAWAALGNSIIPQIFAGKGRNDSVRVWTIGCATGEEAYSIAILLLEYTRELVAPPTIQVFASDLGKMALNFAREGVYPSAIADNISEARLARFFTQENSHYRVRPELRETVLFTQHNLLQDPPFSRLDLIICRNLLIYIQRELQEKVFETFYYALRGEDSQQGFLFLGNAESTEGVSELFDTLDKRHRLYQRHIRQHVPPILPSLPLIPRVARLPTLETDGSPILRRSPGAEHQHLLEVAAPPTILVDRNSNVLHLSESAGRYLLTPGGRPTMNLFKLVRPELQAELRAALLRAFEEHKAIATRPIPVRFNGAPHPVYLMVRPHQSTEGAPYALVLFWEDETPIITESDTHSSGPTTDSGRKQLENELKDVQNQMQSLREEYETTVEELRAANEELQSTNEEYKSTLEELETSKEELQSVNEELQTINQELKTKIDEVTHAHSDVQNLFIATDIATLFLDRELRVNRYTPRAAELFNLMPLDRGRPITHLRSNLLYHELESDAQQVLSHSAPVEREAQSQDGRWFLIRVRPFYTLGYQIDGVVITFVDISERKQIEETVRRHQEMFSALVENAPFGVYMVDAAFRLRTINAGSRAVFSHIEPLIGRDFAEILRIIWKEPFASEAIELFHHTLATGESYLSPPIVEQRANIHAIQAYDWQIHRITLPDGRYGVVCYFYDLSEQKRLEEQVRRAAELDAFRLKLNDALRSLSDANQIQATVAWMAMDYFKAERCYYCEVEEGNAVIRHDAARGNLPSVVGVYPLERLPLYKAAMDTGRSLAVSDANVADFMDEALKRLCIELQTISFMNVPVIKNGEYVGNLCITQSTVREWSEFEIALAKEIAERTWATLERARAEEALRQSETKYRTLFNSIEEGFCLIEMLYDETGNVADWRYLEVNRIFERQTGFENVIGQLGSDVTPGTERYWLESYGRVAQTGDPLRFENYHQDSGRWYLAYASRVGGEDSRQVAIVFDDITERKRREANLAFLAEISSDFAPFASADELMMHLCEKLAGYLGLSRCGLSVVDVEANRIVTIYDWRRDEDAPSVLGEHAISTFLTAEAKQQYIEGNMAVVNDTHHNLMVNAPPEMMDALRIRAVVDSPYLENGLWKFLISVCRSEASIWRADEIDLIREVTARIYIRLERAHAEDALRESEGRFRLMANTLPQIIWLTDAQGRVEFFNKRWADYSGVPYEPTTAAEVAARFIHSDDAPAVMAAFTEALQTGLPFEVEQRNRAASGEYRWFLNRAAPYRDPQTDAILHWFGVGIDIQDRKLAEAALRESEERQAFLLTLSDALRPLTDPVAIQKQAVRVLGEHLGADRVGYAEVQDDSDTVVVTHNYIYGVPGIEGRYDYNAYGRTLLHELQAGQTVFYPDIANDPSLTDAEKASYAAQQLGSIVNIPLVKAGRLVAMLFVHCKGAYSWRSTDLELMQETADRTWAAVERARSEERLRQREAELARVQRIGGVGGLDIDVTNGLTGRRSPEYLRLHGLTAASSTETHEEWLRRIHPEDRERAEQILLSALTGTHTRYENEYRIIRPNDGEERWIAAVATIERDAEGRPTRLVGAHIDITERKRTEEALRQSEERLQLAISIDTVGVLFFTLDGQLLDANQAFLNMCGYSRDELRNMLHWEALTAPEYRDVTAQAAQALTTRGETAPYEKVMVRQDGSRWWSLCAPKRLRATARDGECVEFLIDISERKAAEVALQRLNATLEEQVKARTAQVRELASTLTLGEQKERRRLSQLLHDEIQQLFYGIQMRLQSVVQDIEPTASSQVMGAVEELDTWLSEAIRMVRQLTVDLSPPVLKGEGLTDALRWLVRQMQEVNGLHVTLRAAQAFRLPDEDMRVLLFQIVRELLFNVVKHAGTDQATVELEEGDAGRLRIRVSDQGRGFDLAAAEARHDGGFGLFSVRERLDLFGGQMEIQSAPGQGTQITLTVPSGVTSWDSRTVGQ